MSQKRCILYYPTAANLIHLLNLQCNVLLTHGPSATAEPLVVISTG